eukprot:TRINITY_DN10000_c0_g1_i1.p1 TRINITY_DN10000_c0_g1~~TRINITY_DN10000_c0_g1_i1.p1  ORF type:complete len:163 (+),score=53.61 TRINITY_DN10000_c0_g1_i1:71-490(+)
MADAAELVMMSALSASVDAFCSGEGDPEPSEEAAMDEGCGEAEWEEWEEGEEDGDRTPSLPPQSRSSAEPATRDSHWLASFSASDRVFPTASAAAAAPSFSSAPPASSQVDVAASPMFLPLLKSWYAAGYWTGLASAAS